MVLFSRLQCTFNRVFCTKMFRCTFNRDSTFNREIAILCDCSVQICRNNQTFCIFYHQNDKKIRLKIGYFTNEEGISLYHYITLVSLISEHARLEKNSSFSSLLTLIRACSFIRFLGILPCSLSFHQRKCPFSSLLALIRSCSFIRILEKFLPARLLKPACLLETVEYRVVIGMDQWVRLHPLI